MAYILHLLIFIALYAVLAQSLNLAAGLTGLISLAHAGFYAIGAYTTAILAEQLQLPFWVNLPVAMLVCFIISLVCSLIALRTVDDYFIICTLGLQVIIFSVLNNWTTLTKGPAGISGISQISLFGRTLESKTALLFLSALLMLIVWYVLHNLFNSAFGKTLLAIKEDEIYAASIGKNVYQSKVMSYAISASIAAIPGVLYAHYVSYIDPTSFTISESIFILSIVIIGGMGSLTGSFLASAFMVFLPEGLRFLGMPSNVAANMRQIIFGALLVLVMVGRKNSLESLFAKLKRRTYSPRR